MMNYLKAIFLSILTVTATLAGFSQQEFSLEEAKKYALEHSYFGKKAQMDVEAARDRVRETTAIGLPQINGSAEFQNFIDIPTQVVPNFISPVVGQSLVNYDVIDPSQVRPPNPEYIPAQFGTEYNISAGLSANQLIFDGSYIVGLRAAKTYRELSKNAKVKTEQEIISGVTQAYTGVIVSTENLKTLENNLGTLEKTYNETNALYEEGFTAEEDVDQLKILLQSTQNQVQRAKRLTDISLHLLKYQMGLPVDTTITLTDSLDAILAYGNSPDAKNQEFNPASNIDYRIAATNKEIQYLNYKNEQAKALPKLNAFFNYNQNYLSNELEVSDGDFWYPSTVWGVSLQVPIFSSLMRHYKIQQAKIEMEKAEVDMRQTTQQLSVEFLQAKSSYLTTLNEFQNNKESLELSRKILKKQTFKYKEGVSSSLDLAQAQRQFFQTQAQYINSINSLIESKTNLDQILNNL